MIFFLVLFFLLLTLELICKYRLWNLKSLGYFTIYYDLILLTLIFLLLYLDNESISKNADFYEKHINTTNDSSEVQYEYINTSDIITINTQINLWGSIIVFMLCMRSTFYISASPIIMFMVNLFYIVFIKLFNIFCVMSIFIFSFSLIFHTILGKRELIWSDITNSILIILNSIIGQLDTTTFNTTTPQSVIILYFEIIVNLL